MQEHPPLTDTPGAGTGPTTPRPSFRLLIRDADTVFKLVAVLGLQMGQRFPSAFVGLMLTAIYRENGLPLDMLWVFSIPAIPTFLRPLWAPYLDGLGSRRFGMRKTWFVPCTVAGTLAYLALGWFEPVMANLTIVIGILTVKSLFMTTQDIAIDGYMVENLNPEERAAGAAAMDIARNVAEFVSLAGIIGIYWAFGWEVATACAASLLFLSAIPAIVRREPPPPEHAERARARGERPSFFGVFQRPDMRMILMLVIIIAFANGLIARLYIPYLVDLGFRPGEVALVIGAASLLGTLIGASAAAAILHRIGFKPSIMLSCVLIVPTVAAVIWMGFVDSPGWLVVFTVTLIAITLPSLLEVALAASRLKWASRRQAGTDYSTMVVAMVVAGSAALAVGGWLAERMGWALYFAGIGGFVVACAFAFYLLYDRVEHLVAERERAELDEVRADDLRHQPQTVS